MWYYIMGFYHIFHLLPYSNPLDERRAILMSTINIIITNFLFSSNQDHEWIVMVMMMAVVFLI